MHGDVRGDVVCYGRRVGGGGEEITEYGVGRVAATSALSTSFGAIISRKAWRKGRHIRRGYPDLVVDGRASCSPALSPAVSACVPCVPLRSRFILPMIVVSSSHGFEADSQRRDGGMNVSDLYLDR